MLLSSMLSGRLETVLKELFTQDDLVVGDYAKVAMDYPAPGCGGTVWQIQGDRCRLAGDDVNSFYWYPLSALHKAEEIDEFADFGEDFSTESLPRKEVRSNPRNEP